ncbi:four-helix bundle copper-binding protein [Chloroflexia bacterium SDU3-3]|nr:four-helix bundle copper-binding protein [Chloroflexia bacterium SDU3-3]
MSHATEHQMEMDVSMQECITHCLNCHSACTQTSIHCLSMGGKHAAPEHIRLLQDCAQACATSADFMLRMSPFHPSFCQACADVCTACADDCTRLADGDQMMMACAQVCRSCAESCAQMAAMA